MAYSRDKDYRGTTSKGREQSPAREAFAITPGASDLARYCRALYIGTAGNVAGIPVDSADDTVVTFANVPVGVLNVAFRRVTTAPSGTIGLR